MQKFIDYMRDKNLSENTWKSYYSDINLYKKYYKDSFGEELTTLVHSDIAMYRSYLLKHNISALTINRKISALKMYNEYLVSIKKQEKIVIVDKDYIKVQNTLVQKKLPTVREVNLLKHFSCRDTKNAKRDYCVIVLLSNGGFREDELVNIRLVDIKLEERFINIIGKGNKFRQVMINDLMYNALKDYMEERASMNIENPYLFVGQKNQNTQRPFNRNFCNRLLDKYKEICKIDGIHPHALRSYFCSHALHDAGYTIDQVANQAGHSSLNTTKGYLQSDKKDLLTLANQL